MKRPQPAPATRNVYLFLVLALLIGYSNHFENSFHFDDFHTITENSSIRDLHNIPRFFTDARLFSTMPDHATWRPLVSVSLAIDYWLGRGLNPFWFHVSTFFWFALQVVLMFQLFRRIMDRADPHPSNVWTAAFAAALYGLHPVSAETVNYIIQRGDLYCTLGIVGSLLWFISKPGQRRYGLYLLPAIAACLSKAPALVFPAILVAYVYFFEGWKNLKRPAVLLSLPVCAALAILTARMTPPAFNAGAASASLYRLTQPLVALHYFVSFFAPTSLTADTDWSYVEGALSFGAVVGYIFLVALLWWILRAAREDATKPIAFGLCWFIIALLPTSLMPLAEVTNDHRMFFPFVGLTLAIAWSARMFVFRHTARLAIHPGWQKAAAVAAGVVLVAALYGTRERNDVWQSEESLWRDVVIKSPKNGRGLMNYGLIFLPRAEYSTALTYFNRALAYTPNYWSLEINLGIAYGGLGRNAEAEQHFLRAIALAPNMADPYFYYGRWLKQVGRVEESAARVEQAVRISPGYIDARRLLADISAELSQTPTPENLLLLSHEYFHARRYADSLAAAQKALALKPGFAEAYNNIAAAYNALGKWDDGIQAATEAVRLKPDDQLARNNLAWAIEQKTKGSDADRAR